MRTRKRSVNSKAMVLLLAVVFAVCGTISGSIAWLVDYSEDVKSTFMVGNVNITMTSGTSGSNVSTFGLNENDDTAGAYYMVPGLTLEINAPTITVVGGSEECYLFVKITEYMGALPTPNGETFQDYLHYTLENGWYQLVDDYDNPVEGVYYTIVEYDEDDQEFDVIFNNEVTVDGYKVTKDVLDTIDSEVDYPELTFKSYAVQLNQTSTTQFTPMEAWALISDSGN